MYTLRNSYFSNGYWFYFSQFMSKALKSQSPITLK